ncbi:Putative DNA ligase-like protein Rv0938/MT0965 [Legionella longbeachae]|nr:DNA polymerase LigD, polymerase domain protein [Legionella oakridgensis RV-2-2007]KTD38762.1 DNA polymerase LigD, polymerase domain protein [Legionella oakridgensis]STY20947.1 Putative DNA ligase-like protein Rv0938/MT0965 [Legionella longbeachae]
MEIHEVEISHPDKILFSEDHFLKKDIAEYYCRIAPYILPWIEGRPITLKRYPDGIEHEGFFNKHVPDYFPDFIQRLQVPMETEGGLNMNMVGVNEARDLVYLAGQNTIELHVALAKMQDVKKPDQIIFDLDPADNDFEKVRAVALELKDLLDFMEVSSFVKTSGSKGVHIHVPIKVCGSFKEIKIIARKLAEKLHERCLDLTTLEQRKKKRGRKVFIDYLRNDYAMTAVAPYSLRALRHAPIATPIEWEELADKALGPQSYHLKNIFRRLAKKQNSWKNFAQKSKDIRSFTL